MDKTLLSLLGAVGALVASAPSHAAPLAPSADTVLQARSYAELLQPVPNALATLRAMDAAPEGQIEQVQLGPVVRDLVEGRRHHHHHHHRYYRPRYHHHHHHHHNRSPYYR